MGIKRKKAAARPRFEQRWQELATSGLRKDEARRAYMTANPGVNLVEAHRAVQQFHQDYVRTYGSTY